MNRRTVLQRAALAAGWLPAGIVRGATDAQAVLAASDAVRNPAKPFAVTLTLIE